MIRYEARLAESRVRDAARLRAHQDSAERYAAGIIEFARKRSEEQVQLSNEGTELGAHFRDDEVENAWDFIGFLEANNRFKGTPLKIVTGVERARLKRVFFFGITVDPVPRTVLRDMRGYEIGRRIPEPNNKTQPSEGTIYLCQDGKLRESGPLHATVPNLGVALPQDIPDTSKGIHEVKPGNLEIGRYVANGRVVPSQNIDTRADISYQEYRFAKMNLDALLIIHARESMH